MNATPNQPTRTTETIVYAPRERLIYVEENTELGIRAHVVAEQISSLTLATAVVKMSAANGCELQARPDGTWAGQYQRAVGPFPTDDDYALCHFCGCGRTYRHDELCHYAHLNPPPSTSTLFVWMDTLGGEIYCSEHGGSTLTAAIKGAPRKRTHQLWSGVWRKVRVDHADHIYCESPGCKTRPDQAE